MIFQVTSAIQKAVAGLKAGIPMPAADALTFEQYENLLGLPAWAQIEDEFVRRHEVLGVPGSETKAA